LRLVVAGSTLEGEERAAGGLAAAAEADPRLVMVLAPRHPERFGAVAALLELRSSGSGARIGVRSGPANARSR
jgi:3-deoxy-D-manno-octulosonic-acid transferase